MTFSKTSVGTKGSHPFLPIRAPWTWLPARLLGHPAAVSFSRNEENRCRKNHHHIFLWFALCPSWPDFGCLHRKNCQGNGKPFPLIVRWEGQNVCGTCAYECIEVGWCQSSKCHLLWPLDVQMKEQMYKWDQEIKSNRNKALTLVWLLMCRWE